LQFVVDLTKLDVANHVHQVFFELGELSNDGRAFPRYIYIRCGVAVVYRELDISEEGAFIFGEERGKLLD
jgi:hypothetical protein